MLYVTVIVLLAPGASSAKLQGKAVAQSPVLETKLKPVGVGSLTTKLTALLGPSLVIVMVYETFVPATPLTGPVLVTLTSALETMLVGSLSELFVVSNSPPPETFAVFVKLEAPVLPAANCSTVTGMLMLG
jgi:hypothetical protein